VQFCSALNSRRFFRPGFFMSGLFRSDYFGRGFCKELEILKNPTGSGLRSFSQEK
jgi:hypothetical protein